MKIHHENLDTSRELQKSHWKLGHFTKCGIAIQLISIYFLEWKGQFASERGPAGSWTMCRVPYLKGLGGVSEWNEISSRLRLRQADLGMIGLWEPGVPGHFQMGLLLLSITIFGPYENMRSVLLEPLVFPREDASLNI